jgi:hypothetical protein
MQPCPYNIREILGKISIALNFPTLLLNPSNIERAQRRYEIYLSKGLDKTKAREIAVKSLYQD